MFVNVVFGLRQVKAAMKRAMGRAMTKAFSTKVLAGAKWQSEEEERLAAEAAAAEAAAAEAAAAAVPLYDPL
jgi:hypothetical protein